MNHKNQYHNDFPLLAENPLVYLGSVATVQKPSYVIQAERDFHECYNANPICGFYTLSLKATDRLEKARGEVRWFIDTSSADEVVFTRNATESLNLAAYSYRLSHLRTGDEILVGMMKHHDNLFPWQMVARQAGASLRFPGCEKDGRIAQGRLDQTFSRHARLVAIAHVPNMLGCVSPIKEIMSIARKYEAVVILDAAQSVPHMSIDVRALDVDPLAFSDHKLMGPMGIEVLYGKRALLKEIPSFLTGGEMIDSVIRTNAVFAPVPHKFEVDTVNAAGVWRLAATADYLKTIGFDEIHRQESALATAALEGLGQIPHVRALGSEKPEEHYGILTFTIGGVHPHGVSAILDSDEIAVRTSRHCARPLFECLKVNSATRASLCFYNTQEEIATLLRSVSGIRRKVGYGE